MTYCIHVWGSTHAIHLSKLTVLQKRAIRIIAGVTSRSHTEPLFQEYKLIKFDDIFTLSTSLFMYKFHHRLLPNTFEKFFRTNLEFHSYETRQREMLNTPFCRTDITQRTIRYWGVNIWNKILALNINVSLGVATFKYHIKKSLLQGHFS